MNITIKSSRTVGGNIAAPPSKSMAHRAVLCAALAKGTSHLHHLAFSKDISATLGAAGRLCARVTTGENDAVVEGLGRFLPVDAPVDCCESGSTLRFLIPLASLTGQEVTFTGLFHPADSIIDCGGVKIGRGEKIAVMAGPCSIEGEEQALRIANGVKAGGASLFRGGAYKPRTSPYSFQGLETEGILDMVKAREATGMPIVSELMSEDRIPEFEEYVDVVQIGARNMQNFQLLKAVGKMHKPVLLKRGLCNTIEEWIMSAEYIMAGGNEQVILCERGIRTFEKYTRNTLDLSAVPIIHEKTHLPIIVDPSHATGKANLVEPMMIAAVAAGADGLEVEVHYDPRHAWSDGAQCLTPDAFAQAMAKCRQVAWAIGRDM